MCILETKGLSKSFGGLLALNNVGIRVNEKEILGLVGPNGAGKSTLFKVISGFYSASRGEVTFKGKKITRLRPDQIARLGIVRTFQDVALYRGTTVLENVLMGFSMGRKHGSWGGFFNTRSYRKEEKELVEKSRELLRLFGLEDLEGTLIKNLPYGHQRALGVAIAVAAGPQLLLLDEPVTGMNAEETELMMDHIKKLREMGVTLMLVEHDMRAVMGTCDRIVVLNFGNKIAEGSPDEIRNNESVIQAYLGIDEE